MSMSEIAAMAQSSPSLDRQQAIGATGIPTGVVNSLAGKGIHYDIDNVQEVNGIPIAALRWALDEVVRQSGSPAQALCAG